MSFSTITVRTLNVHTNNGMILINILFEIMFSCNNIYHASNTIFYDF